MSTKKTNTPVDGSGNAEIRIPLVRRIGANQKPYYLAHLPGNVTVLVFTQCAQPAIVLKKTTERP